MFFEQLEHLILACFDTLLFCTLKDIGRQNYSIKSIIVASKLSESKAL